MRRRLFDITATLSLLLCAATCVLWGRCYGAPHRITVSRVLDRPINVGIGDQRTVFEHSAAVGENSLTLLRWWYHKGGGGDLGFQVGHAPTSAPSARPWQANWFGFCYFNQEWESFGRREVALQLWFLVALLGVAPAAWVASRRAGTHQSGRCVACGYDLRATPGRCPECGIAAGAAA